MVGSVLLLTPNAKAFTPQQNVSDAILERINIQLSAGEGMFDSHWGYERDVYEVKDIYHLPNPTDISETSATFETHITVLAEIRHFTLYGKDRTYWNARSETEKYKWLEIISADNWAWTLVEDRIHDVYNVEYQDYEFYPKSILEPSNYIRAKGYEGKFDLTVNFDRFEDAYGIVNDVNESVVSISTMEIVPVKATITEADTVFSGNWSAEFNGFGETKVTVMDYTTIKPATDTYNAMDSIVHTRINNLVRDEIIGVYAIEEKPMGFTDGYSGTLGYQGSEWVYRGDLTRKTPYVFELPTTNRPRILIYEQQIKRGNCMMAIDTQGLGAGFKDGTPIINYFGTSDSPFRQVGWHIQENTHIQTVEIKFVAKAMLEAEPLVLERLLEEPLIRRGDVIWNIAMTGSTDANLIIDSGFLQDLWGKFVNSGLLTWIIVGVIVVGIGFLGFKAYRSPMVQQKIGAKKAQLSQSPNRKKVKNVKRNKGKLRKALNNLKSKMK